MTDNGNASRSHDFRLDQCRRAASAHPPYIPRTILGFTPEDSRTVPPDGHARMRLCPRFLIVPEADRRAALLLHTYKCSTRTLLGR